MTDNIEKDLSKSIIYGTDGKLSVTNGMGETFDITPIGNVQIDLAAEGGDTTVASFQKMEWGHVEVDFKFDPEAWEMYNRTFSPSRLGGVVLDTPISTVGFPVIGTFPFVFAQVEAQKYQESMEQLRLSFEKAGEAVVHGWSYGWNWMMQGSIGWDFPRLTRTPVTMASRLRTQYPGLNKRKAERLAQSLRKRGMK